MRLQALVPSMRRKENRRKEPVFFSAHGRDKSLPLYAQLVLKKDQEDFKRLNQIKDLIELLLSLPMLLKPSWSFFNEKGVFAPHR